MRLDKYLKVSRLIKRRTVAKDACSGDRVTVNGKDAKPAYDVKIGDIITECDGTKVETVEDINKILDVDCNTVIINTNSMGSYTNIEGEINLNFYYEADNRSLLHHNSQ